MTNRLVFGGTSPTRRRMLHAARTWIARALAEKPNHGRFLRTAARIEERDPHSTAERTLDAYTRAWKGDRPHRRTAYERACILREMGLWREAVAAFEAIPASVYVDTFAWGLEDALASRAWCVTRAGDREAGEALWGRLLDRWRGAPELLTYAPASLLLEAASRDFPKLRSQFLELIALAPTIDREDFESDLFSSSMDDE